MLLERDDLRAELRALRDRAAEGDGSLVFLGGEAGSGKTTLVGEFLGSLDRSTLTVVGNCDPLTTPRPLGPLIDFSRDPDAGLEDLDPVAHGTFELFEIVLDRARTSIRPMVLVIEDVHWADEATIDFLRFMGRRIADSRAVVICTYRDDELAEDQPVRRVLGELAPLPSTTRLTVPALTSAAVATLVEGTGIDPARLHGATGGNAFFVTEVIAAGGDLPGTVTDAVLSRLMRLDVGARAIVEAVSIAPRYLEIDRAIALSDGAVSDVDGAVASGMLISEGPNLRFRHELARSAIEDSLPPARSLTLHRHMVRLLEDDRPPDVARLAHHAIRAGDGALVVQYAPAAADEAAARGARREAVSFYEAALAYAAMLEPDRAARVNFDLGRELQRIERTEESLAALDRAIELFRADGDTRSVARALVVQQPATWIVDGEAAALAKTDEARRLLELDGPSEELALVHSRIAHNHMVDRRRIPALEAAQRAKTVATDVGSVEAEWRADLMSGCVEMVCGDADRGVAMLTESLAAAEELGDIDLINMALSMLGTGGGEARRYEAAIPALERGVNHAVATDQDGSAAYNRAWQARVAFERGEWDAAARLAENALASTTEPTGAAAVTALCSLGRTRVRRGDPGGVALLEQVLAIADDHLFQYVWNAYCGLAERGWLVNALDSVPDWLEHGFERARSTDSPWAQGEVGFWMWRAGRLTEPPTAAAEPFALQMDGAWEAAAEAWRSIGCPYEEAMALADGDEHSLRRSVALLDELGAAPAAARVRGRLRDLGAVGVPRGPSTSTRSNPALLTDRQVAVLELMAQGLSNRQIAERLYITKKTAEHHVSAVLAKLGADNRTMAVSMAIERGYLET